MRKSIGASRPRKTNLRKMFTLLDDDDDDDELLIRGMMQRSVTLHSMAMPTVLHIKTGPKIRRKYKAYDESRKFHCKAASLSPMGLLHMSKRKTKSVFRVDKKTFDLLYSKIFPDKLEWESKEGRNHMAVGHEEALRMFLYYLTTIGSWSSVGLCFGREGEVVKRYVALIAHVFAHLLKDEHIRWPTKEEQLKTSDHWLQHTGFPGAIGAVDGTHIKILDLPTVDWTAKWRCYKGFHSTNVQALVDEDLRWRWVGVGCPGGTHDSGAFKQFPVATDRAAYPIHHTCHMLGDPAFELSTWLLVPHSGRLQHEQQQFNTLHSAARMSVERAFGVMKARFPRLEGLKVGRAAEDIRTWDIVWDSILACFVLHNMLLDDTAYTVQVHEVFVVDDAWDDLYSPRHGDMHESINTDDEKRRARDKRARITQKYLNSNVSSRYHYGHNLPPIPMRRGV